MTGNAVTTIKSNDNVKIFTVRGTSFEPAAVDGSGVPQENGNYPNFAYHDPDIYSKWVVNFNYSWYLT